METKKVRLSGIELLKVISVILIIFSHSIPYYGDAAADYYFDINSASGNFQLVMMSYFRYFGQIGNAIFIFCSAYFLIESKTVKVKKMLYIIVDTFVISMIYLCGFLIGGYKLSAGNIALQFVPITSRFNWFIGCYLIIYAAHPLLNKIIHGTSKRNLLIFNIFLFVLYNVFEFVGGEVLNMYYYTHLVGFFCLYFFAGYIKLHMQDFMNNTKLQTIILVGCIICHTALFTLTEYLGLKLDFMSDKINHWDEINNPFMIGIAISSFALFSKLKFYSKFINYISSLSLLIYIIHENKLLRDLVRPQYFKLIYEKFSYNYLVPWCILLVVITFLAATALAALYKESVGRLTKLVIDKSYLKLAPVGNKLLDKLDKKDTDKPENTEYTDKPENDENIKS